MINNSKQRKKWVFNKNLISKASGYGTVLITCSLLFFFLILPVSKLMSKALFGPQGFTLDYFSLLFANGLQVESMINSLKIGFLTTLLCTLLSFPLAIINCRFEFPGKNLLTGLLLVPMIMPPFVGAIGIQRLFARFGSVNMQLIEWGLINQPIEWLSGSNMLWAVVILEVLHLYPIMYLNLSAAIANIDPSLEEMATTLGVSKWRRLKDLAWPLCRPGYFAGSIIVFVWALTDLGTPLLVGFHSTMPVRIFNMVTDVHENPMGFALVFLVIILTVSVFLLSKTFLGTQKFQMMAKGHVSSAVRPSTKWECLAIYPTLLGIVSLALIPHLSVILTSFSENWFMTILPEQFSTKYYQMVFQQELPLIGIKNSFFFASLATLFDIILGLTIAYIVSRRIIPFANWLDALVMIPLALPGIVLAFGYVISYSDTFLDPLHNPAPLLVIAYAIRRLPYMVRSATAGLQQINISLEEAAATLGASRFKTLRTVTFPLVTANLIAGALLCFSYAMLDVSDSLILAMKDQFYPLTKAIYAIYQEQGSGEFVASALGVISMAIMAVCILSSSLILGKKMGEIFRS